jgi:hypothetical protein
MRKTCGYAVCAVLVIWGALAGIGLAAENPSPARTVDFRFAPPWWQTSICLPDDWQKTLVGKEGSLLYDWGGGKHWGFKTKITFDLNEETQWVRQELVSPRVPIVRTIKKSGTIEIIEEAFAVAPPLEAAARDKTKIAIERIGQPGANVDWAMPTVACDPAFKDIAVGWNEPVQYRFRAEAGKPYSVVLGLCEGWHKEPGQRVLDLQVEGKTLKTVDMVAEHGANVPAVFELSARDENGDGWIDVSVAAAPQSKDKNTILNVLWVFEGKAAGLDDLLKGKGSGALLRVACGTDSLNAGPPRHDVVLVRLRNTGAGDVRVSPLVVIESDQPIGALAKGIVEIGTGTRLVWPGTGAEEVSADKKKVVLHQGSVVIPAGGQIELSFGAIRGGRDEAPLPKDAAQAGQLRARAERYWREANLPYGHLEVPDAGVQALLDSSVRNIYQAREIKEGLPAFQVGPTCYRGLWVVDGSFLMEAVTFVGRGDEARNGIRYLLKRQGKDGGFMLIDGHWKETGIVLWAVSRHAKLMGDKAWLKEVWPNVERGFAYIQAMRNRAAPDEKAPNYRLVPAGFPDGGLGERLPEYTNIYWTLAGMKAAVESAHWIGQDDQAAAWQKEYDDFYATFRRAAQRDMKTDAFGNRCLPIYMVKNENVPVQKAQWAFLHAVFPGKVFAADDPLLVGNMAMLRAVESEGLVFDTGWLSKGLWNYFGSFYGHAWLWLGDRQKAIDTMYAFANHASPLGVWREEHMPQGKGNQYVGDMPHNWASAEFVRLIRHLLVLERGDELHLLEGLPVEWVKAGMTTRLREVATEFGPISLEVRVSQDGSKATVRVEPPRRNPARRVVIHREGWSKENGPIEAGNEGVMEREVLLR